MSYAYCEYLFLPHPIVLEKQNQAKWNIRVSIFVVCIIADVANDLWSE